MRNACPCCSSPARKKDFQARELAYRVCRGCGSAWLTRRMDLQEYYQDYFPQGVRKDSPILSRRYGVILDQLRKLAPGSSVLEVGCGNGQLLSVAREREWEVAGTELSRAQVEHCRSRGLRVEFGDLVSHDLFSQECFHGGILIEVFEHLPRPVTLLQGMADRLAPGGVLYLTTPNFRALSRRLLGGNWSVLNVEHVTLATPEGLRAALAEAGFHPLEVQSRNLNVTELRHRLGVRRQKRREGEARNGPAALDRPQAAAELRDRIESSSILRLMKRTVNAGLNLFGTGDTLVAWARKIA